MESCAPLQQILGTDKKNPVFTVYRDEKRKRLHVYYGGELLEKVPEDKEHPEFRLLVGRLYNAGVKVDALKEAFGVDPKTMKCWGEVLKSGDPARLARMLAGRSARRKFTSEIQGYVRVRFPSIYGETRYEYSKRILSEIQEVFGTELSAETIRPLLGELKEKAVKESEDCRDEKQESACDCEEEIERKALEGSSGNPGENNPSSGLEANFGCTENPRDSPDDSQEPSEELRLCHHLGVLLFSAVFLRLDACTKQDGWLLKQWAATILLGAVNIEQTKLLDFTDLKRFLGQTVRSLREQRMALTRLAMLDTVNALLRLNAQEVNAPLCTDFYYDPHTKHYTGEEKILKGWCPSIRFADKALHMDFIHTEKGDPVYIEPADNYEDLRERFLKTLDRFRSTVGIGKEKELTFIVDRGIHSRELFQGISGNEHYHLITWEKGYRTGDWKAEEVTGSFLLERSRNRAADIQTYRFEYIDQDWQKDTSMRLLRVQATNPKGRMVELGVLTDDKERNAQEVITLIFRRWIQENDFKYLDKHFGINEITSYAVIFYRELKAHLDDKEMVSGAWKALKKEQKEVRKKLGEFLVREQRYPGKNAKRTKRINSLSQRLKTIEEEMKTTEKEESRLEFLIEQDYVRLDTRKKHVMDALKLIARNIFYKMLQPFKKMYDNYRDDHDLFRNLTQCNGVMRQQGDGVEAILLPTAHYPPKVRGIVEQTLRDINATNPLMPDGSNRSLRFRLGPKDGIELAIASGDNPST